VSSGQLRQAVAGFAETYKHDPTFRDIVWKLEQIMVELDLLDISPGRREARLAARPNPAGQEPTDRVEAPAYVQET
jgi:hypothetical protein